MSFKKIPFCGRSSVDQGRRSARYPSRQRRAQSAEAVQSDEQIQESRSPGKLKNTHKS